ncbi:MAG: ABC-type tungstate transport system permease subunit [Alteromonadaceae bacterium]|jgi:ABC-type tungstate transport system permease subunit
MKTDALDRAYILSGRNTIIHKQKKLDLVLINDDDDPLLKVTHQGVSIFNQPLPKNRREAKERYLEIISVSAQEVFSEPKTLLFIQALDGREYKVDYSKKGTSQFVRVHQESYL